MSANSPNEDVSMVSVGRHIVVLQADQNGSHDQQAQPALQQHHRPSRQSIDAVAAMSGRETTQYWYARAHRALRQRACDPNQMLREYQHIAALDEGIDYTVSVAKSTAAAGRNRYCNVLPYDFNRVKLQGEQHYVNASLIQLQLPMIERSCTYIATQGPLPATCVDFWHMVYQLKVPAVVMLTNVNEAGMSKCAQYYPAHVQGKSHIPAPENPQAGTLVEKSSSQPILELQVEQVLPFSPDCTLRTMRLSSLNGSGSSHVLNHYHLHSWPDHGTPDSSSGIRAICRALSTARESGAPIVVHCSAGIGRTGTFIAIDILLQRLDAWQSCGGGKGPDRREVEAALNLPHLVHELRRQRMGMVQTLSQYVFVYKAILDDLAARTK